MNQSTGATSVQRFLLVLLRFSIGWHLFYQGLGKFRAVEWTARGFLEAASGPFASLFQGIAESPKLMAWADFLTVWGLMVLGILLMVGLFTRVSALGGIALLMLFYLAAPPLASEGFTVMSSEGAELYVNKTLLEALALLLVFSFPTGRMVGLDILLRHRRESKQAASSGA